MVVDGTLQTAGKFGIIELYYHGIEGSATTPGNQRTINSFTNGSPVVINMDGNPTAGVYLARRNHNSYDGHNIPNPILKFNSGLEISGDLDNQYITKSGQAVSGITIANGSMDINGNLSINLTNMNSSSEVDFSNVVPTIEDLPNTPDWDIVYGWSSLDQANSNSSEQPHDINLLQAGIATGFSQLNVNGNASINVSGTNGLLAGWYWAPNFRTQYSGTDFDQIDARDGICQGTSKQFF